MAQLLQTLDVPCPKHKNVPGIGLELQRTARKYKTHHLLGGQMWTNLKNPAEGHLVSCMLVPFGLRARNRTKKVGPHPGSYTESMFRFYLDVSRVF